MAAVRRRPKEEESMEQSGKGQPGCPAHLGKAARRHSLLLGMLSGKLLSLLRTPHGPKAPFPPPPSGNPSRHLAAEHQETLPPRPMPPALRGSAPLPRPAEPFVRRGRRREPRRSRSGRPVTDGDLLCEGEGDEEQRQPHGDAGDDLVQRQLQPQTLESRLRRLLQQEVGEDVLGGDVRDGHGGPGPVRSGTTRPGPAQHA